MKSASEKGLRGKYLRTFLTHFWKEPPKYINIIINKASRDFKDKVTLIVSKYTQTVYPLRLTCFQNKQTWEVKPVKNQIKQLRFSKQSPQCLHKCLKVSLQCVSSDTVFQWTGFSWSATKKSSHLLLEFLWYWNKQISVSASKAGSRKADTLTKTH